MNKNLDMMVFINLIKIISDIYSEYFVYFYMYNDKIHSAFFILKQDLCLMSIKSELFFFLMTTITCAHG